MRGLAVMLSAVMLLGMAVQSAGAETRSLKLYFLHTKERAEITYKKNGRYIPGGLNELNRFLRDWRRNEPTKMDPRLFDLIWEVYQKSGSRDYIHVVSGYRSPATNSMLRSRSRGVAKKSQHMLGKAMDFYLPDVKLATLRGIGLRLQGGGVGYYPSSGSPFVHLDVGSVRHWPRMNRKQLLAVFPDGKTLHVPTDGKPLPGYDVALASYNKRKGGSSFALASVTEETESASGSGSRKSGRGFFATLFGGGRDEEEETDVNFPSSAPDTKKPAAAPEPEPEPVQVVVAALPDRDVPKPVFAPRPAAELAVAVTSSDDNADTGTREQLLALNIPPPSPRPAYKPAQQPVEAVYASVLRPNDVDEVKNVLLAALVQEQVQPEAKATEMLASAGNSFVTGAPRPDFAPESRSAALTGETVRQGQPQDGGVELPQMVPAPEGRGATAAKQARLGSTVLTASLSPAVATAPRVFSDTDMITGGVRTASKQAKPEPADELPEAKPVVLPIDRSVARWAFKASRVPEIRSADTLARSAIRTQPTVVLTLGFGDAPADAEPHRFSGKAVTFLSVAKFSATN